MSVTLHVSKTLNNFLIYRFLSLTLEQDQWRIDQSNDHSQIEFSFSHALMHQLCHVQPTFVHLSSMF